ncbi:hypothetical protein SGLAM104S_02444 [Streptomyces glaucescens]
MKTQPLTWLSDYLHAARKHFGPFGQASWSSLGAVQERGLA